QEVLLLVEDAHGASRDLDPPIEELGLLADLGGIRLELGPERGADGEQELRLFHRDLDRPRAPRLAGHAQDARRLDGRFRQRPGVERKVKNASRHSAKSPVIPVFSWRRDARGIRVLRARSAKRRGYRTPHRASKGAEKCRVYAGMCPSIRMMNLWSFGSGAGTALA